MEIEKELLKKEIEYQNLLEEAPPSDLSRGEETLYLLKKRSDLIRLEQEIAKIEYLVKVEKIKND